MLLIGYLLRGPLGARRLCEEAPPTWPIVGSVGSVWKVTHSTFSKNGHGRFRDADILRRVLETTVQTCMDAGLVGSLRTRASSAWTLAGRTTYQAPMIMIGLVAPAVTGRAVLFGNVDWFAR